MPEGEERDRALAEASRPFRYVDKGSMATIAKFSAVTKIGKIQITGFVAWVAWLVLHGGFGSWLGTSS